MWSSITSFMILYFVASYLTVSSLFQPCFAGIINTDTFETKSGRYIYLDQIRDYVQLSNESNLEYMIFEYDHTSNSLYSFHRSINLPDALNRSKISFSPNVTRSSDSNTLFSDGPSAVTYSRDDSNIYMSTSQNGDTFLFDADKNYSLIGAFGNALDLHLISRYQPVFINHFKISDVDTHIKPLQQSKTCKTTYEYNLHVISDPFMYRRYGSERFLTLYMIEKFVYQSIKMFMDVACIDIQLKKVTSFQTAPKYLNFQHNQCDSDSLTEVECQTSIAEHIMQQINGYPYYPNGPKELVLFISGIVR